MRDWRVKGKVIRGNVDLALSGCDFNGDRAS